MSEGSRQRKASTAEPEPEQARGQIIYPRQLAPDQGCYLEALRAGNRVAVAQLYREHVDHIEGLVYRVMGPDQEHQDLVQEVFLHAIRGLDRYRGEVDGLRGWLSVIAINRVRRRIRSRKARRWLGLSDDGVVPTQTASDDPTINHALRRAFTLIKKLGTEERIVFTMRCVEQMTFPEIAKLCAISESTAKRRFSKARARFDRWAGRDAILRAWLSQEEP